jgi:hypothetical protein
VTITPNKQISAQITPEEDPAHVFSSQFLEFAAKDMNIAKQILDFAIKAIAGVHQLLSNSYMVEDHYIIYFSKKLLVSPDKSLLNDINKQLTSAVNMLRLFLSDKQNRIIEIQ